MKKRSLVSAIAMLVVSAIVLTSATFAWFASGSIATVDDISASVGNAEGSIQISADNGKTWKNALTVEDFKAAAADAGHQLPDTLSPVSVQDGGSAIGDVVAGAIDAGVFTANTDNMDAKYVKYSIMVRAASDDCVVNYDTTFSKENGKAHLFAAVTDPTTGFKVAGTESYFPYTGAAATTAEDTNGNFVIDEAEAADYVADAAVQGEGELDGTLNLTVGTPQTLYFYMWAEGQHTACNGQASETGTLAINFAIAD